MTHAEFVARAMALPGIPWVRWRSDWTGADCFGLLVLYHREVLGFDLGPVPQTDLAAGFAIAPGWSTCSADTGAACFMAWRNGAPSHCGLVLQGGRLLHAEGAPDRPGRVRISRLSVIAQVYGDLTFHRYAPPPC
jgi:cell wall-associated NlpC family hydrolase